jgi:hypothetical protein
MFKLKTKAGNDWEPTEQKIDTWKETFPNCDVEAELRKMALWLEDNPARRKTAKGLPRFCSSWLTRANEMGGSPRLTVNMKRSMREWSALDHLTHDFLNSESYRKFALRRYGQYVTFDGERVEA